MERRRIEKLTTTVLAYERENGRVGTRNHVLIIPLDDLSNAAAEGVENLKMKEGAEN